MLVRLHISLAGVPLGKSKVEIEAPEKATVRQALAQYTDQYKVPFRFENMKGVIVLINNAPSKLDRVLADGDEIKVFKPHAGG